MAGVETGGAQLGGGARLGAADCVAPAASVAEAEPVDVCVGAAVTGGEEFAAASVVEAAVVPAVAELGGDGAVCGTVLAEDGAVQCVWSAVALIVCKGGAALESVAAGVDGATDASTAAGGGSDGGDGGAAAAGADAAEDDVGGAPGSDAVCVEDDSGTAGVAVVAAVVSVRAPLAVIEPTGAALTGAESARARAGR